MIKPEESLKSIQKSKGDCCICGASLKDLPSICVAVTIFFKKMSAGACLKCAKELRDLIDVRISEVSKCTS